MFPTEIPRASGLLLAAWIFAPKWWLPLVEFSIAYLWYLIMSTCQFILKGRESTLKELNSRFQQLMKRRQRIQGVIPEAADFFNQLDSGMKTILEDADRRFALYAEQATCMIGN